MLFSVLILGLALQTKFEAVLSEETDAAGSHHSNSLLKADEEQAAEKAATLYQREHDVDEKAAAAK